MTGRRNRNSVNPVPRPYRGHVRCRAPRGPPHLGNSQCIYASIGNHNAFMKKAVVLWLLLNALIGRAFGADHSFAAKMLENAAINHDLARIRMTFERDIQRPYDPWTKENKSGSHGANAKPAAP